jgi:hypothetical protein
MKETDKTEERLKSCMIMEWTCAGVFHLLAINFPQEKDLWNKLAMDEESHAEVIAAGMKFGEPEDHAGYEVPWDLEYLRKTVEYAREMKVLFSEKRTSAADILSRVKRLLELKGESYRHDLVGKENEERVRRVFQKLFDMDSSKQEVVRALMKKYGQ